VRPVGGFKVGDRVGQQTAYGSLCGKNAFRYGTIYSVTHFGAGVACKLMIFWDDASPLHVTPCTSPESLRPESEVRILEARVRLGDPDA